MSEAPAPTQETPWVNQSHTSLASPEMDPDGLGATKAYREMYNGLWLAGRIA